MAFDYKYRVNIKNIIQIIVGFKNKKLMIHTGSTKHLVLKTPLINEFY